MKRATAHLALAAMLLTAMVGGASAATVRATVDKNKVQPFEPLRLSVTVTYERSVDSEPQLPALDGVQITPGGTQQQISSINGAVTRTMTFTWQLTPAKVGTFTVPPLALSADGRRLQTQAITVQMIEGVKQTYAELVAAVDKAEVYLGEPVLLTLTAYIAADQNVDLASLAWRIPWLPAMEHFLMEPIEPTDRRTAYAATVNSDQQFAMFFSPASRDGKSTIAITLKRLLYPLAAGAHTIEPAIIGYNRLVRVDRSSLFPRPVYEQGGDASEPVTLTVLPLPDDGKPADFTGAVGSYRFTAAASPQQVNVGELVTLKMTIAGRGNVKPIQMPAVNPGDAFRAYDAEAETKTSTADDSLAGEKTFSLPLRAQREGQLEIPAVRFSFFDPDAKAYRTITQGPYPITVTPGESGVAEAMIVTSTGPDRPDVKISTQDILTIKSDLRALRHCGGPLYANGLLLVLLPLPALACIAALFIQRRTARLRTDVSYARSRAARRAVGRRLASARKLARAGDAAFFGAVAEAMANYIADKLNVSTARAAHREIYDDLAARGASAEALEELDEFQHTCDAARFASSGESQMTIDATLRAAEQLIERFEKELKGA